MLRAFMRKNFIHFWDGSSTLSKVDNFDILKGPGFFSTSPKSSNVFLKTKFQRKQTALGAKFLHSSSILYNECFALVKLLLMTMK